MARDYACVMDPSSIRRMATSSTSTGGAAVSVSSRVQRRAALTNGRAIPSHCSRGCLGVAVGEWAVEPFQAARVDPELLPRDLDDHLAVVARPPPRIDVHRVGIIGYGFPTRSHRSLRSFTRRCHATSSSLIFEGARAATGTVCC
jgi:hypothetical protein